MKVRVSRSISIRFLPNERYLFDSFLCTKIEIDSLGTLGFIEFVEEVSDWVELNDATNLLAKFAEVNLEVASKEINYLLAGGFLESSKTDCQSYHMDHEREWMDKGWLEPFHFHYHTNNLTKLNYSKDGEKKDQDRMQKYVNEETPPSNYKEIDSLAIQLKKGPTSSKIAIGDVFTNNTYKPEEVKDGNFNFDKFSELMYLTAGEVTSKTLYVTGEHVGKTSPSGGARHPIEVYVIAHHLESVNPGIYHYNVKKHCLNLVSGGDYSKFVKSHILKHPNRPGFVAKATLVYTCIFDRSMFRYREPRSYRVMNLDLGHVMQTTAMVATSLGMSTYRGYSLDEIEVEKLLQVDLLMESSMAFCAIG